MLLERRRSRSGSSTTGGEFGRRAISKSAMGPLVVVVASPIRGERLGRRHVLEHLGDERHSPVVLGIPGDEPLLGVIALEILGLVLDPLQRTFRPMKLRLG